MWTALLRHPGCGAGHANTRWRSYHPDQHELVEHALQGVPAVLASLSKGACVAATRGLAMELAKDNIRVNAVSLGIIKTPLHETNSLEGKKSFAPLNRYGEVSDVVRAVLYLEDSDFVTGEISYIDGGRTAGH